ncbi:TatD family hydrolase [Bathymodiolus septemdierum thioautotrophic gill symbiont]|uniref:TatD DNase family protein n=1 Tax=endosymbiont of Bathymodiolus septemdierum str. Myojin knoll TaxID=1303921 RepID=A0A0P0UQ39_9GAMM|nr:TatD family hydrolase [Bathymodiolus septemdierum thioautotrophic gill symbiont]BAS67130.1 TatD DNase family protein [endosymbiont of Bathymodiolus septemdierum str. Myojin knoll]
MKIIDSHCHLDRVDLSAFGGSMESMLAHAKTLSVEEFLCVCIDLEHFDDVFSLAKKYPRIYASVGVHPCELEGQDPTVEELLILAAHDKIIAIGETGLDYFHVEKDTADWQRERFRRHIAASNQSGKPMIIHTRNAREDTIAIMREEKAEKGVIHCFSENWDMAKKAMDLGFYISFSGIVTFKSAKELQEVAKKMPLDRILVETDSPYLTPVPFRGKPNSPAYTYYSVEKIAEIRGESIEKIAESTTNNFRQLFSM